MVPPRPASRSANGTATCTSGRSRTGDDTGTVGHQLDQGRRPPGLPRHLDRGSHPLHPSSTAAVTTAASSTGRRTRMVAVPSSPHLVHIETRSATPESVWSSRPRSNRHIRSSWSAFISWAKRTQLGLVGGVGHRHNARTCEYDNRPAENSSVTNGNPPEHAPPAAAPGPWTARWSIGSTASAHTSGSPAPPTPPVGRTRPAPATTGTTPTTAAPPTRPAPPPPPPIGTSVNPTAMHQQYAPP